MQRIFPEDIELINKRLVERRNGILLSKKKFMMNKQLKSVLYAYQKKKLQNVNCVINTHV